MLIALALNVQRYAHIRLQRKRAQIRERAKQSIKNAAAAAAAAAQAQAQATAGVYGGAGTSAGDGSGSGNGNGAGGANGGLVGGVSSSRSSIVDGARYSDDDARDSSETMPLARSFRSDASSRGEDDYDDADGGTKVASTYLKDPYWWLGQVLIMVGEMGNFLAYGFAPASIVSPLGVVALVSNCVIAPLLFKEVFRQRDFWGVLIAITGAVTVVLSAKTEETKLGPHEVWGAITTMEFEIYLGVSCALIVFLMWLSPRYGSRTILIDLGLVGLFGTCRMLPTRERSWGQTRADRGSPRRLHGPFDQGSVLHALVDAFPCIHHPGYIRACFHPRFYSRHAGPISQQGPAALRFHPGYPHPVCPLHSMCHHWQRRPLPGL